MNQHIVNELTGIELEYAFAKAMQYEVMGINTGPFVLQSTAESRVHVFSCPKECVIHSSFATDLAEIPLQKGMELGAALYVENGIAKCRLQGVSTEGKDYLQALMRAIVIHFSSNQEQIRPENK